MTAHDVDISEKHAIRSSLGGSQSSQPQNPITSEISTPQSETIDVTKAAQTSVSEGGDEVYPDGGLRAWLVVFGCWCALFASLGIMNSLGIFQAYVAQNQLKNYSDGSIGWIFSVYTFMAWFGGIFVGPLFDKYGPRWLILSGSIATVASVMLLGQCNEYWHFLLDFGILAGSGTALLFTPSFAAIGHYFMKGRGLATGLAAGGGSVGGIVFPLMLDKLIPKIGFSWSTKIVGLLCLVLCIIANLLISRRLKPFSNATVYPNFRIFRNLAFSLTTFAVFVLEWGLFIPITYLTSYAFAQGYSQASSYQILVIMNAASFFGRWMPGFFADKCGRYNAMILSVLLNIIAVLCIWLPVGNTVAGLTCFAIVSGFASGANVSLIPVCIGQLCPTQVYGRYYATCYTAVSIGCLTGIPIGGEILVHDHYQYWGLMVFVGMCYIGSLAALVVVRVLATGWKLKAVY